jgi:hypothetical protein
VMGAVGYAVRRWWWAKWHPFVRTGWMVTRTNPGGSNAQSYLGIGLIAAGLILRSRKSLKLYSATVPADQEIRIRVVRNGRTIGTG